MEKAGNAKKDVVLFEDNILSTSNGTSANLYDLPYLATAECFQRKTDLSLAIIF